MRSTRFKYTQQAQQMLDTHVSTQKSKLLASGLTVKPALLILKACHHLSYPSGMGKSILKMDVFTYPF